MITVDAFLKAISGNGVIITNRDVLDEFMREYLSFYKGGVNNFIINLQEKEKLEKKED